MDTDIYKLNECPDCASRNIIKSLMREQVICRECGLIFEPFATAAQPILEKAKKPKSKAGKKAKKRRK